MEKRGRIWFSSDWHLSHKNITGPEVSSWKEGYRNFKTTEQMDEAILSNINSCVAQDDHIYYLGDFYFGDRGKSGDGDKMQAMRDRIVCRNITFIKGNHDKEKQIRAVFGHCLDYLEEDIEGIKFVMLHFAMRIWNKSHRGAIHLYGHSHSKLEGEPWGKSMDVGIDAHPQFRPFSLEEVMKIMNAREVKLIDHHGTSKNRKDEPRSN